MLYDVKPADLPAYAVATLLLGAAAALAAYLPARRAAGADPVEAMRRA